MRTLHTVRWSVSLSNGETIHEGKGEYEEKDGELSPWQKLLAHIAECGASITSLTLSTESGATFALPSAGKNPRFKAFADAPKPVGYKMFRKIGVDVVSKDGGMGKEELYTCAEAQYEDGRKMQIWVSEETHNAWTLLV